MKRDLYEGGIRIPFIAWWPDKIRKRTVSKHVSAFWDFLPTACELAGIGIPDDIDGISFLPSLLNNDQDKHEYLYWEFHEMGKKQAVRIGKWKGVRLNVLENPDAPVELYNLEEYPTETTDISGSFPDIVKRIEEIMNEAHCPDPNRSLFRKF